MYTILCDIFIYPLLTSKHFFAIIRHILERVKKEQEDEEVSILKEDIIEKLEITPKQLDNAIEELKKKF